MCDFSALAAEQMKMLVTAAVAANKLIACTGVFAHKIFLHKSVLLKLGEKTVEGGFCNGSVLLF